MQINAGAGVFLHCTASLLTHHELTAIDLEAQKLVSAQVFEQRTTLNKLLLGSQHSWVEVIAVSQAKPLDMRSKLPGASSVLSCCSRYFRASWRFMNFLTLELGRPLASSLACSPL